MNKKPDKASLFTAAVIAVLCVFFVGGFLIGLDTVMDMEGSYPPVVNEEGLTPAPGSKEEALVFLDRALGKAQSEKPKISTDAKFSADGGSVETDGPEQFGQALQYVRGDAEKRLASSVEKPSVSFGEDPSDLLRFPGLTADRLDGFTCEYIFYQCPSCGKKSDTPLPDCADCGCAEPYDLRFADNYRITLKVKNTYDNLRTCFAPRTEKEYLALVNDAMDGKAELDRIGIAYTGLEIYYEVSRLTDQITFLSYRKSFDVSFDATDAFRGEWSRFSGGSVKFPMTESYDFSFTWPALTLSDHYMSVEPKGSENLLAALTCDDPTKYDVTWTSSDESVVKVDGEGYFDAGKTPGRAVITASYEFGGATYSDQCLIDVKVSVERLSMKHKKIKLAAGETEQISVRFVPSDVTDKTLTWHTGDESIATVDADGVVTAVSAGKVTVYCISNDGYFKSSCEVTVV